MADKEARAVGAGDTVEVAGREYLLRPLTFRELTEVQRAAVAWYKRQYLKTYADNADLLGDSATAVLEAKMEEAARWDVDDLPRKRAYDVRNVKRTPDLLDAMEKLYGVRPRGARQVQALLATALDSEQMTAEQVRTLTGTRPITGLVPYDTWWITAVYDGMVTFVWTAVRGADASVTRDAVAGWPFAAVATAARVVERLTSPAVGNT